MIKATIQADKPIEITVDYVAAILKKDIKEAANHITANGLRTEMPLSMKNDFICSDPRVDKVFLCVSPENIDRCRFMVTIDNEHYFSEFHTCE